MSHLPQRSASTPYQYTDQTQKAQTSHQSNTLDWHKDKYKQQQEAWQKKHVVSDSALTRIKPRTDKPLPIPRRQRTEDRGPLRIANPDLPSAQPPPATRQFDNALDGSPAVLDPPAQARSVNEPSYQQHHQQEHAQRIPRAQAPPIHRQRPAASGPASKPRARKPVPSGELFFDTHSHPSQPPTSVPLKHTPHLNSFPSIPVSLIAGQHPQSHARTSRLPSEVGDPGMLGIPLSVADFRGTLPSKLQPLEPLRRRDPEPAPQLPPIRSSATVGLYGDSELTKFMTADQSGLQPFRGRMPLATTIVRGDLRKVVGE